MPLAAGLPGPLEQPVEPLDEAADGPGGEGVLAHPRQLEAGDRRADVERHPVVGHRRPAGQQQPPRGGVDAGGRGDDHPRPGAPGQRQDVDLQLVGAVLAGDEARHHARVDGDRRVHHQRQPAARRRLHGEAAQHLDVGVAAADEDEVAESRRGSGHRGRSAGAGKVEPGECVPGLDVGDEIGG